MIARLPLIALLLTACTSVTNIRGPYAAALSPVDIQQIRRVAQKSPHFGHTVFVLDAVQTDRVHVLTREYKDSGWDGANIYVIRHGGRWCRDEHTPIQWNSSREVIIY